MTAAPPPSSSGLGNSAPSGLSFPSLGLPHEPADLTPAGRLSPSQRDRSLSIYVPWSRRDELPAVRAAFPHFGDGELVLLVHPDNKWAILARRLPAPRLKGKTSTQARCRLPRSASPRNYRHRNP